MKKIILLVILIITVIGLNINAQAFHLEAGKTIFNNPDIPKLNFEASVYAKIYYWQDRIGTWFIYMVYPDKAGYPAAIRPNLDFTTINSSHSYYFYGKQGDIDSKFLIATEAYGFLIPTYNSYGGYPMATQYVNNKYYHRTYDTNYKFGNPYYYTFSCYRYYNAPFNEWQNYASAATYNTDTYGIGSNCNHLLVDPASIVPLTSEEFEWYEDREFTELDIEIGDIPDEAVTFFGSLYKIIPIEIMVILCTGFLLLISAAVIRILYKG